MNSNKVSWLSRQFVMFLLISCLTAQVAVASAEPCKDKEHPVPGGAAIPAAAKAAADIADADAEDDQIQFGDTSISWSLKGKPNDPQNLGKLIPGLLDPKKKVMTFLRLNMNRLINRDLKVDSGKLVISSKQLGSQNITLESTDNSSIRLEQDKKNPTKGHFVLNNFRVNSPFGHPNDKFEITLDLATNQISMIDQAFATANPAVAAQLKSKSCNQWEQTANGTPNTGALQFLCYEIPSKEKPAGDFAARMRFGGNRLALSPSKDPKRRGLTVSMTPSSPAARNPASFFELGKIDGLVSTDVGLAGLGINQVIELDNIELFVQGKPIQIKGPLKVRMAQNSDGTITFLPEKPGSKIEWTTDNKDESSTISLGSITFSPGSEGSSFKVTDFAMFTNPKTTELSRLSQFHVNPGFSAYSFSNLESKNGNLTVDDLSYVNQSLASVTVFNAKKMQQEKGGKGEPVSKIHEGEFFITTNTDSLPLGVASFIPPFSMIFGPSKTTDYLKVEFGTEKDSAGQTKPFVVHNGLPEFFGDLQSATSGPVLYMPYVAKALSKGEGRVYLRKGAYDEKLLSDKDKKTEEGIVTQARSLKPVGREQVATLANGYRNAFNESRMAIKNAYIDVKYDEKTGYSKMDTSHATDGTFMAIVSGMWSGNSPKGDVAAWVRNGLTCFLPPGSGLLFLNFPRMISGADDLFKKVPGLAELSTMPDKLAALPKLDPSRQNEQVMLYLASAVLDKSEKTCEFTVDDIKKGATAPKCAPILAKLSDDKIDKVRGQLIKYLDSQVKYNVASTNQIQARLQLKMAEATERVAKSFLINDRIVHLQQDYLTEQDPAKRIEIERQIRAEAVGLTQLFRGLEKMKDEVYQISGNKQDMDRFEKWIEEKIKELGGVNVRALAQDTYEKRGGVLDLAQEISVNSRKILAVRLIERTHRDSHNEKLLNETNEVQHMLEAKNLFLQIVTLSDFAASRQVADVNTKINQMLSTLEHDYLDKYPSVKARMQDWIGTKLSTLASTSGSEVTSLSRKIVGIRLAKRVSAQSNDSGFLRAQNREQERLSSELQKLLSAVPASTERQVARPARAVAAQPAKPARTREVASRRAGRGD